MRIGLIVVALVALPLAAGCMVVVDGGAHPAPGLAPRPLLGQAVSHALLDKDELAKLVGEHFKSKPESPPRFGGREQLYDVRAAPRGCAGVVYELQKSSYGTADVENVAQRTWWTAGIRGAKVISVVESAVAVPTGAAADAVFAGFIQQWDRCNGTTVRSDFRIGHVITAAISDVRAANSVLAATVQSHLVTTVTSARAVGVRANCLVEVDVAFFSDNKPDGTAVDLAHAMMDKVSSLS
jgi:PknH-like extracellular domain